MGKIFYQALNFPQNELVLVSYFGYNCGMINEMIFYQLRPPGFPEKNITEM